MDIDVMARIIGTLHPEAYDALFPHTPLIRAADRQARLAGAQVAVIEAVRHIAETVVVAESVAGPGAGRKLIADWDDGDICPPWLVWKFPFPVPVPDPDPDPWWDEASARELVAATLATVAGELAAHELADAFTAKAEGIAAAARV